MSSPFLVMGGKMLPHFPQPCPQAVFQELLQCCLSTGCPSAHEKCSYSPTEIFQQIITTSILIFGLGSKGLLLSLRLAADVDEHSCLDPFKLGVF